MKISAQSFTNWRTAASYRPKPLREFSQIDSSSVEHRQNPGSGRGNPGWMSPERSSIRQVLPHYNTDALGTGVKSVESKSL